MAVALCHQKGLWRKVIDSKYSVGRGALCSNDFSAVLRALMRLAYRSILEMAGINLSLRHALRWGTALKFCFGKIIGLAMEVSKKHILNYSDLLEIEMPLL